MPDYHRPFRPNNTVIGGRPNSAQYQTWKITPLRARAVPSLSTRVPIAAAKMFPFGRNPRHSSNNVIPFSPSCLPLLPTLLDPCGFSSRSLCRKRKSHGSPSVWSRRITSQEWSSASFWGCFWISRPCAESVIPGASRPLVPANTSRCRQPLLLLLPAAPPKSSKWYSSFLSLKFWRRAWNCWLFWPIPWSGYLPIIVSLISLLVLNFLV